MNPTNEQIEEMILGMFDLDISELDIEEICQLKDLLLMRIKNDYGK